MANSRAKEHPRTDHGQGMTVMAALRAEKGLTQEQVAKELGISRAHYTNIENGRRLPSLPLAARIALFYGCGKDLLFDDRKVAI